MKAIANTLANLLIGLVVLLHFGFLAMEMFFWTTPTIRELFDLTLEQSTLMAPLAANMGLYNGFLAVGLIWGLWTKNERFAIKTFFLICIIIAGIYGALTIKQSILYTQATPGAIALMTLWLAQATNGVADKSE